MIEIESNEKIVRVVRRHWIVLVFGGISLLFILLLPILIIAVLSQIGLGDMIEFTGSSWAAAGFFFFAWMFIVWMVGWDKFTDYYLDVLIITDKRFFDIEQYGLFRRRSSAFRMDRIQNVSVNVHGIIQTLLDYGTIRLETAGEREDFIAPYVPDPYEVKRFISQAQDNIEDSPQSVQIDGDHISTIADGVSERLTRQDSDGL